MKLRVSEEKEIKRVPVRALGRRSWARGSAGVGAVARCLPCRCRGQLGLVNNLLMGSFSKLAGGLVLRPGANGEKPANESPTAQPPMHEKVREDIFG